MSFFMSLADAPRAELRNLARLLNSSERGGTDVPHKKRKTKRRRANSAAKTSRKKNR